MQAMWSLVSGTEGQPGRNLQLAEADVPRERRRLPDAQWMGDNGPQNGNTRATLSASDSAR